MGIDDTQAASRQVSALDDVRTANAALKNVLAGSTGTEQAFGVSLRGAVRTLAEALQRHEEVSEGSGGNIEFILQEKPALSPVVGRQRAEHHDMGARSSHIEGLIGEQLAFDRMDPNMLRLEAQVLCDIVELHIARATDLLYEAMYTVEGGEQG